LILKLGEAGAVSLWVGPTVLQEAESVLKRKSPASRPHMALRAETLPFSAGTPGEFLDWYRQRIMEIE
jgi:hypothetical protein